MSSNESIIKDDRVTTYRQFGNKYGKFNLDRVFFLLVFANIYVGVQMVDIKFQTVNLYTLYMIYTSVQTVCIYMYGS